MSDLTKRALAQSLAKLLRKKTLNKITIQDIADESGISRNTFYYHFSDIYALVEWACREAFSTALEGGRDYENWQQGTLSIMRILRENQALFYNVYSCIGRDKLEPYLRPIIQQIIQPIVADQAQGRSVSEADQAFIAEFYQYAFVGVILRWTEQGMAEEPEELVARIATAIRGTVGVVLSNFEQKPGIAPK